VYFIVGGWIYSGPQEVPTFIATPHRQKCSAVCHILYTTAIHKHTTLHISLWYQTTFRNVWCVYKWSYCI